MLWPPVSPAAYDGSEKPSPLDGTQEGLAWLSEI